MDEKEIHHQMVNATSHLANRALQDEFFTALAKVSESYGIVFHRVEITLGYEEDGTEDLRIATQILHPPMGEDE